MAKKARKTKEPPAQEKEIPENGGSLKQEEEEKEQIAETQELENEVLKQYLEKSKAELREICRAKGIRGFSNLKHADLAKLALDGANNPEKSNLRNDQLRLRLRELGMKGVSGSRADLIAKVSEAEFYISRVKAAMNIINPGSGEQIDPATFEGDPKILLELFLSVIESTKQK